MDEIVEDPSTKDSGGEDTSAEESDAEIIRVAKARFKMAVEAEHDIRIAALEDLNFRAGEQWDPRIKKSRQEDERPTITINRIPQFVRQVTNDQRQNRPSIKASPVDDKADLDTANILQGIIRHIEYSSNADVAYDTGFEGAATKGFGYWRIVTEYCDAMSFEQEIRIKRIRNAFSVYLDPTHQEPDASDMNWGFIFEDISREDYKAQFPGSELVRTNEWDSIGHDDPQWANNEHGTIRVAEYFYKVFENVDIVLLQTTTGTEVVEKKKLPEVLPEGFKVLKEKKATVEKIKWVKLNSREILDRTDWLGKWIPIVPVLGDELDVDGKRILEGVIRHAKDPQRMYNYWASAETETIALAPRAPFIGFEGQFEGFEEQWKQANKKNFAYLQVKPVTIGGIQVPLPQRNAYEPPVQAITGARMQSSEDLKATTGIYDAALGNRSNETSGRAIQRRTEQAQTSNFHFIDNLKRAQRHTGRILIDLIPKVYDTPRAIRIMNEDGTVDMVRINEMFEKNGEKKHYRLDAGKYDVTVDSGPSFASKRQEAAETILEFIRVYPQAAQLIGDLLAKNMDWPGATEIAKRLRKMLPPGIAEPEEGEQQPLPPEAMAQIQQLDAMVQQLTKQLEVQSDIVNNKRLELESKERIEFAKLENQAQIELAKLGSKEDIELLKQQVSELNNRQYMVGFNEPIENPNQILESDVGAPGAGVEEQPPTGGYPPGQPMGS